MAVLMYVCWYYPVGLYRNAEPTDAVTERGALMFLYLLMFMLFTGTFSTFIIAGFETAEAGGNLANLMFTLCLIFCGVLAQPNTLPRFWIFMCKYQSPSAFASKRAFLTSKSRSRIAVHIFGQRPVINRRG